jgi:hypothetical protein
MTTNAEKIAILTEDKNNNLTKIAELGQYTTSLNAQIDYNLSMNADYETEKTNSATKTSELEANNLIIDEMIADYS